MLVLRFQVYLMEDFIVPVPEELLLVAIIHVLVLKWVFPFSEKVISRLEIFQFIPRTVLRRTTSTEVFGQF